MTALRYVFYALASVVLSTSSFLFGGITQLALWRSAGRTRFLLLNGSIFLLLVLVGAPAVFGPFGIVALLIYLFAELEHRGQNMRRAAFVSILTLSFLTAGFFGVKVYRSGTGFQSAIQESVRGDFNRAIQAFPDLKVDIEELVMQAPSMFIIALISTLWMALILERRVRITFGDRVGIKRVTYLSDFRVPIIAVWPALASFVGGYILKGHPTARIASLNVFNIFVFIYFLQGIAVVATLFRVYRVRLLWQALTYIILFVQLVPVSLFGFLDIWLDFRSRVQRKSPEIV